MTSTSLARQLGTLFEGGSMAGLSDRQLLERFLGRREPIAEAAFAAIVARHGPMVLGVCRQLLGDYHHAEDAFQAVFLVLARRAHAIRDPNVLGAWLYGVAVRTARKARARRDRVRRTEEANFVHALKAAALSFLLLAVLATGAGHLHAFAQSREGEAFGEPRPDPARTEPRPTEEPCAAEQRMTVSGRVLDPDGQPAAGAPVDIIGASRTLIAGTDVERPAYIVLGQGSADGDGRFRIEAARPASARFYRAYALAGAAAPGFGFGSVQLQPDAEGPAAEIRLQPEQVIRGKLVDVNGQPAAGVEVHLHSVYSESPRLGGGRFDSPRPVRGYVWSVAPAGLRAWPKAVTTDARGRFAFAGVGRGLRVTLAVRDPRFAQQRLEFLAGDRDAAKEVSLALQPSTIIEGRALAADTGQPIPNAVISVRASNRMGVGMGTTKFRADDQGRFRVNPFAGGYFQMGAFPPEGQPYLPQEAQLTWTKGAIKKAIDFQLPRGVLLRGKVARERSHEPVAGASIQFFPMGPPGDIVSGYESLVNSKDDGSFQVAVPPGKGHLMVMGPTGDDIPREIGGGKLYGDGRPGGHRFYAHAIIAYEVKAGDGPHEVIATLSPGKTVRGHVIGPAGETVADAVILTRQQLDPINLTWDQHNFIHTRNGRFELPGFDPEKAAPAYFLDADHGWGARVELSGKNAGEEITVRLQPCGQAKARFVGPDGQPVARLNVSIYVQILMTPGAETAGRADQGEPAADGAYLPNVDRKRYPNELATDADGRVVLPALIPGAPYRISDWSTVNVAGKGYQIRKDFTVKPGETVDLGDVLVEKPGE